MFVELTSPENGYPDPQILEDNLVFTLESGAVQKVNLNAYTWDADILTDVTVKDELVLEGSKPTIIYGMMRVEEGATLRIPTTDDGGYGRGECGASGRQDGQDVRLPAI